MSNAFHNCLNELANIYDVEKQELQFKFEEQIRLLEEGKQELESKVEALAAQFEARGQELAALNEAQEAKDAALAELKAKLDAALKKQQADDAVQQKKLAAQQLLMVARTNAKQLEANAQLKAGEIVRAAEKEAIRKDQQAKEKVDHVQAEIANARKTLEVEKQKQEAARQTLAEEAARQVKAKVDIAKKQASVDNFDAGSVSNASTYDTETTQWERRGSWEAQQEWHQWHDSAPMYDGSYDAWTPTTGFGNEPLFVGDNATSVGGCVYYS